MSAPRRIVCFGPGPMFKGGISQYNTSLARSLAAAPGTEVHIVSWTQQYPAIIPRDFVDRSSRQSLLEGTGIPVTYLTDYNRPSTWRQTAAHIAALKPDTVVFQWAIALQGLPMGRIARMLKRLSPGTEILFDVHVLVQKEASAVDRLFTRYGLEAADGYIVHAYKTAEELQAVFPRTPMRVSENGQRGGSGKLIIKLFHPVYDLFKPDPAFDVQAFKASMGLRKHVFLFFGFIRKYKGLHNVIPAFAQVAAERQDVSLLIVGESFWHTLDRSKWSTRLKEAVFGLAKKLLVRNSDDERGYNPLALIESLKLGPEVAVVNQFVPNEEVHRYFQASDAILTYYLTATPSGVESLAYNFRLPVLATRVGHFPETIRDGFNGYLAEPEDVDSMAEQMRRFLAQPLSGDHVAEAAAQMSWANYAKAVLGRA
ncbi:MAG: glycosyltransferase [Bacteroidia bacterium]|nr:glycosyltransferase [Bacteroidia bacterium]